MHYNAKVALFRQGRFVLNESPATGTFHWAERDWVRWIDAHGRWETNPIKAPVKQKVAFGHSWAYDPTVGKYRLKQSA